MFRWLLGAALVFSSLPTQGQDSDIRPATDEEVESFLAFVRANFDDIHDVSMRFHAVDPGIDGLITLSMVWEDGRMVSAEVSGNETGNEEEPAALLDKISGWSVDSLKGPCRLVIPFRIRLVGRDHPAFPERAIVTGSVRDAEGNPVHGARIRLTVAEGTATPGEAGAQGQTDPPGPAAATDGDPRQDGGAPAIHDVGSENNAPPDGGAPPEARTNREGIFVRTLVPPGRWTLTCTAEGFGPAAVAGVALAAGQHRIEHFVLERLPEGPGEP